jgi:hypothetical protein
VTIAIGHLPNCPKKFHEFSGPRRRIRNRDRQGVTLQAGAFEHSNINTPAGRRQFTVDHDGRNGSNAQFFGPLRNPHVPQVMHDDFARRTRYSRHGLDCLMADCAAPLNISILRLSAISFCYAVEVTTGCTLECTPGSTGNHTHHARGNVALKSALRRPLHEWPLDPGIKRDGLGSLRMSCGRCDCAGCVAGRGL